ncbi:hypothetical protein L596_005906 [Steinernema carpocapsae]|uniref:Phospholipid/glycerol acyltransferase domain-containing protein n=1 Tax=Steinernema carpocapsae TaxID=34508 RepID=A0A4U8V0L5_STECR|nr:hypothetical protein L596_005906 [Steinernema carpocapsae]
MALFELSSLISLYFYSITVAVLSTTALILCKSGWGPLPHFYVKLVQLIQKLVAPVPDAEWPRNRSKIIEKRFEGMFYSSLESSNISKTSLELTVAGIEAIIQDDLTNVVDSAPTKRWTLLTPPIHFRNQLFPWIVYCSALVFRIFILAPIRLGLLMVSMLWVSAVALVSLVRTYSLKERIYVCISYARLFCASLGLVARYHNPECKPKSPGIAVSNHLSANDIQIIFADVDYNDPIGYTVTGQKHAGFIGWIEKAADRISSTLWVERSQRSDRQAFLQQVIEAAKNQKFDPVLLFPEGYCTNNTSVIQFRKGVFEDGVNIYPVAIRQNPSLGDSFWQEDSFLTYLWRLFTSWAIVLNIYYLPPVTKLPEETQEEFAQRVQLIIAQTVNVDTVQLDLKLLKRKHEQKRYKDDAQKAVSAIISG